MKEVGYQDERLSDGTVCRRFEDGRTEWRSRLPDERVSWRDAGGEQGVDELLGDGVIKRSHQAGKVEYARDQGYGRTAWPNDLLTFNRTVMGPDLTLADMLNVSTNIALPPASLSEMEENELRRRKAQRAPERGVDVDLDGWGADLDGDEGDGDFG